jgi:glutamate-ammonia-ligase adenylyltransferase
LRPWGRDGVLVVTGDGYLDDLHRNARLWEKQAVLKARPVAGDLKLGETCLIQAESSIFGSRPEDIRASVHEIKQRTEQLLQARGHDWGEVKLGEGSIRDVEFVVQYFQLAFGGGYPDIRHGSTLGALPRLAQRGLLSMNSAI